MKFTNQQIFEYTQNLSVFNNCEIKLPVKINFFLQKNIKAIQTAAQEIESARLGIAQTYGELDEKTQSYKIPNENLAKVNQELVDLFSLEQELPITMLKLENFENIELTYQQMSAIIFMIEE